MMGLWEPETSRVKIKEINTQNKQLYPLVILLQYITPPILYHGSIWRWMIILKLTAALTFPVNGFDGLEVACWPLVPKIVGSHPDEAVGYLGRKKILSTPSFGGEVKPSVPCRSFTACKRSLNVTWKSAFRQKLPDISRTQFHLPPLGALAWWHAWRRLVAKVETSKQERTISLKAAVRSCINRQNLPGTQRIGYWVGPKSTPLISRPFIPSFGVTRLTIPTVERINILTVLNSGCTTLSASFSLPNHNESQGESAFVVRWKYLARWRWHMAAVRGMRWPETPKPCSQKQPPIKHICHRNDVEGGS